MCPHPDENDPNAPPEQPAQPSQPNPSQPNPSQPNPSQPNPAEPTRTPEETPFIEPKQYPIHPDIPVQPIHENDPTRC